MRNVVLTALLVVVIAALALPKLHSAAQARPADERGGAKAPKSARSSGKTLPGKTLQVATYRVRPGNFSETISSTGTLRAEEGVELQTETNGKVIAINFTEGSRVRKGDLLVKVNDAEIRATLERATYRRDLARLREQRLVKLLAQRVVTQNDYDTALSDVNVQEAEIALTRAQLAKTEIRAPFDGLVGLRFVSIGAYVDANTRIATLQQIDRLKIDFSVPEKYAGRIGPGTPVTFRVANGERLRGQIYAVEPRIDSGTRTLLGRALCRNEQGRLLPGAFASIEIALNEVHDAILIPAEAIVPGMDDRSVFVVENGKAARRKVETGARLAGTIQVLAGLAPGDEVITSGLVQVRPGQSVVPEARVAEVRPSGAP
jgi:membrane fusion protein (multidrug efflux system)